MPTGFQLPPDEKRTPEEFHDHHLALAVTNDQVQKLCPGRTLCLDQRKA